MNDKNISDLARDKGMKPNTVHTRLRRGWTLKEALEIPVKRKICQLNVPLYKYNNKIMSVKTISEEYNINYKTLHKRLERGWSIEEAIETPLAARKEKKENESE